MTLSRLLEEAQLSPVDQFGDAEINNVQLDSRACGLRSLFVCMPGGTRDSHDFIASAAEAGASAILVYSEAGMAVAKELGVAAALFDNMRDAAWRVAEVVNDYPSRAMKVVGITGTNGKTTVASIVRDMLVKLGVNTAYIGTLGFEMLGVKRELPNTTPFAIELSNLLRQAREAGVETVVMEVSSHALADLRVEGVAFDVGVFTNLTQDHLDFHGSMEAYEAAKYRLFSELGPRSGKEFQAVVNLNDPVGRKWRDQLFAEGQRVLGFSSQVSEQSCVFMGTSREVTVDSITLALHFVGQRATVRVPLGGTYNVENAVSAAATILSLGFTFGEVADALLAARPVRGRFEAVPNPLGFGVLVDYAHTPDALEKLLFATRPLVQKRVITVFGCGGDRDATKRPIMGRIASTASDITIVTSDNPRTEDPISIVRDIMKGVDPGRTVEVVLDRRDAVTRAIQIAQPGDAVIIAGKGHEDYQIIGRVKESMDDRELAMTAIRGRGDL